MTIAIIFGLFGFGCLYYLGLPHVVGARGERRFVRQAKRFLPEEDYTFLNDVYVPSRGKLTQVDHVILSRFGIFVIETKNMSGWIFGSERQPTWTQTFKRRKFKFQNPLRQNFKHVKAIQEIIGNHDEDVHNIVVFIGRARPKTAMPPTVFWSARRVAKYILSHDEPVFSEDLMRQVERQIANAQIPTDRETKRQHLQGLALLAEEEQSMSPKCPQCGVRMVERQSKKTADVFWGCAHFPRCRGTRRVA